MIRVLHGDCLDVLAGMEENSVHAVMTDPPYHLTSIVKRFGKEGSAPAAAGVYGRSSAGFMGKTWDGGRIAFEPETWAAVMRVLKPGGHMLAFGGTRTWHRLACAIEDAGFEYRDTFLWLYGSGFPKSHNPGEQMDRDMWDETELDRGERSHRSAFWGGFGTAVKPAWEPLILARKPLDGTVAANVLKWGCGGLNIDGCRIESGGEHMRGEVKSRNEGTWSGSGGMHTPGRGFVATDSPLGRWPANIAHDGSDEVMASFAAFGTSTSSDQPRHNGEFKSVAKGREPPHTTSGHSDTGSSARFFYTAKADKADRADSKHPTVKPVDLIRHYVRLITPPGGTVLDVFAGSGTTGEAAMLEGFDCILIEKDPKSVKDINHRIKRWSGLDMPLFAAD